MAYELPDAGHRRGDGPGELRLHLAVGADGGEVAEPDVCGMGAVLSEGVEDAFDNRRHLLGHHGGSEHPLQNHEQRLKLPLRG